ncbi:LSU ribosomal protein L9P [Candidatus Ruthia magnifica str. Cm (Calyptogena magnifica)]|uniref:Large ribosomal subunit protein bL9 n=1 Tax=Ruthia magnifica subsp. Calyptogena magnifica TaxID=413404 RepID=RL9_RUTMC|nr:50S ribosomal protein L9 [Candidatus Ruthturnera calyptogenae]A1AWV1.1 RecName: Full=Large ribosomal subunit protein bL9; AltName: Full=50S ribosomal protein L9 [Candidatus Ruthia magnifica str. Cm (Calyptogena magnifica)]ABL02408.1 LSU ribosomal protein L9P [Candidatus Ruthia magnifica str. Cm (Calyptogena magnifica)]
MQVILLEKIQKLGDLGDLANVKAGYARNFLIPRSKVKPATKTNLAKFKLIKAELQASEAKILKNAQVIESKMTGTVCTIQANAGEEGKLFGSINTSDIQISLAASGFEVEKRNINMPETIHHTGKYEISVDLHTDITVSIKVVIEGFQEA